MSVYHFQVLIIAVTCSYGRLTNGFSYKAEMVNVTWMRETWLNNFHAERNYTEKAEKRKTVNFFKDHFRTLSLNVTTDTFTIDDSDKYHFIGTNVMAILPGKQYGSERDRIYIIGSYYDTEPVTERSGSFTETKALLYNGGGIVALLELSRLLVSTGEKEFTIIFVLFDFHYHFKYKGNCCFGAKHFVTTWLPEFLSGLSTKVKVAETILFDSILVYDGYQNLNDGFMSIKEIMDQTKNEKKSNFLLLVSNNKKDRHTIANYIKLFDNVIPKDHRLVTLHLPTVDVNNDVWDTVETQYPLDAIPFYKEGINIMILTDTGDNRGDYRKNKNRQCCKEWPFEMVQALIYSTFLTLELTATSKYAGLIDQNTEILKDTTTTMISTTKKIYSQCRTDFYEYDEKLNLYFKIYNDVTVDWFRAQEYCEMDGARLFQLDTAEEVHYFLFKHVAKYLHVNGLWTGMSDFKNEGHWIWTDGKNVSDDLVPCKISNLNDQFDCADLIPDGSEKSLVRANDCKNAFEFVCTCERQSVSTQESMNAGCINANGYTNIDDINLWYMVFEDRSVTWKEASEFCETNLLTFSTFEEYAYVPYITEDIPRGKYFIGVTYNESVYTTIYGNSKTYPFPINIHDRGKKSSFCGVLIYDDLSPRIGFDDCTKPLPFICGIYCPKKANKDAVKLPLVSYLVIFAIQDRLKVVQNNNDGTVDILTEIITNETVYSLDYLHDHNNIFWHRRSSTHIVHSKVYGHLYISRNIIKTEDTFTDIAVDFITIKLYWACKTTQSIHVSEIDGTRKQILLFNKIKNPHSLQLVADEGKLFWINDDAVNIAGMNGDRSFPRMITDLYVDVDKIRIGSFQTEHRQIIFVKENLFKLSHSMKWIDLNSFCYFVIGNIVDISVLNFDFLIVLTDKSIIAYVFSLRSMDLFYFNPVPVSVYHLQSGEKASVFKVIEKRKVSNPCSIKNGGCENLCLLSAYQRYSCVCRLDGYFLEEVEGTCNKTVCDANNGGCSHECYSTDIYPYFSCGCPKDFSMLIDHKTCIRSTDLVKSLYFAYGDKLIQLLKINDRYINVSMTKTYAISPKGGIDYDPVNGMLYVISDRDSGIHKMHINGTGDTVVFIHDKQYTMESLKLDWLNKNMYFITIQSRSIHMVEMTSRQSSIVVTFRKIIDILDIVIDIFNGYIYTFIRHDSVATDIQQMRIDGSEIKIISTDIIANTRISASLNVLKQTLFWNSGYLGQELRQIHASGRHQKLTLPLHNGLGFRFSALSAIEQDLFAVTRFGTIVHVDLLDDNIKLMIILDLQKYFGIRPEEIETLKSLWYKEKRNDISNVTENCTGVSRCLSYDGKWICLTQDQICDNVYDCYDFHDEMFCNLCFGKCFLSAFQMNCNEDGTSTEENLEATKMFIKWDENVLSKFILFRKLLYHCELKIRTRNEETAEYFEISLYSLHILHRIRQILMQETLRNWQEVRELKLSGPHVLQNWNKSTFQSVSSLRMLHISATDVSFLIKNSFYNLTLLKELFLNLPNLKVADPECFNGLSNLRILYIINTKLRALPMTIFTPLSSLHILNLTNNMITVLSEILSPLVNLTSIDVRGNPIQLNDLFFANNEKLRYIFSDNYALCCIKPSSVSDENCVAIQFDVSSCDDLIENMVLSVCLWVFGILAFFGNFLGIIYRKLVKGKLAKDSYSVFLTCLTISDLLMSLYMLGIAFVDSFYRGSYVWNDNEWRKSIMCQVLGMLSVISSEASVCFIALITIDRYLLVKYPFREVKISKKQTIIISLSIWCFCISLAIAPLFTFDSFYSSSGICTALPLRSNLNPSWIFSFCIFVCFNFFTFIFIAFAQWPIFLKVKETVNKVRSTAENVEYEVAKKLCIVVITDCLCWLPIGIMGMMAISGIYLPRRIYAFVVVFVMPVNAALNPLIYTFSDLLTLQPIILCIKALTQLMQPFVKKIKFIWTHDFCRTMQKLLCWWILIYSIFFTIGMIMFNIVELSDIVKQHHQYGQEIQEKQQIYRQILLSVKNLPSIDVCQTPKIKGVDFVLINNTRLKYTCTNGTVEGRPWQMDFVSYINCRNNIWENINTEICTGCYRDNSAYDSWYLYSDGICFQWALLEATYANAIDHCNFDGTQILVTDEKSTLEKIENTLWSSNVRSAFRGKTVWTDAMFLNKTETGWFYNNGTRMKYTEFFGDMEKIHGKEGDCVVVLPSTLSWKVVSCNEKHAVVCEHVTNVNQN